MITATYTYPLAELSPRQAEVFADLLRKEISSVLMIRSALILPGKVHSVRVLDNKRSMPGLELIISKLAEEILTSRRLRYAAMN